MTVHTTDEPGWGGAAIAGEGDTFAPNLQAQQSQVTDPFAGYGDYFGFDERDKWYFPDGKQWIEYKKLNEGERAKFLKATRSDVHLNQRTQEARIPFDQSRDRKELLLQSVTDWHVVRFYEQHGVRKAMVLPFPGNKTAGGDLGKWIDAADPALLANLEKAIRKVNPWLLNEMTTEQIDKEIADLQELREAAEKREVNEKNS